MKALFISNDPAIFLPESAVRERMRTYAIAIGELHIVSKAARGAKEEQEGPLFLHPVTAPAFLRLAALARSARRVVREHHIDVVSAQDPFEYGRIARKAVAHTKAKLHLQVHTDFLSLFFAKTSWKNRIRVYFADRLLPQADGIRVVSKRIRDGIIARYGDRVVDPSIIPIVPSGNAPAMVPLPQTTFTFAILVAGRVESEKRIEDAINALFQVRKKYPGAGLFVVGEGSARARLTRLARALGLTDAVVFMGEQGTATRGLMKSAQALLQTSAYEGYGRTFIEAALARLPIVSTEVGIIGDVLLPEREVLACNVGDVPCLVAQIGRLIEDNQLRRALAVNAEAAALAHLGHFQNLPTLVAEDLARNARPVRNSGGSV